MEVIKDVKFYLSKRMNIFAVYAGYKYYFVNKNKNNTARWVCSVRECHACILTDNNSPNYKVIKCRKHVCRADPFLTSKLVKSKSRELEPPHSFLENLQSSHSLSISLPPSFTGNSSKSNRNVFQEVTEDGEVSLFYLLMQS